MLSSEDTFRKFENYSECNIPQLGFLGSLKKVRREKSEKNGKI